MTLSSNAIPQSKRLEDFKRNCIRHVALHRTLQKIEPVWLKSEQLHGSKRISVLRVCNYAVTELCLKIDIY